MVLDNFRSKYLNFLFGQKAVMVNRSVDFYEILICPYCLKTKFIFDEKKKDYTCTNPECRKVISKKEFKEFARIEDLNAILFDFNKGKSTNGSDLIFDHHERYAKDILRTATSQVFTYINAVRIMNADQEKIVDVADGEKKEKILYTYPSDLKLGRLFISNLKALMKKRYKFCLTNHLDLDSVLSIFVFRNPVYALENQDFFIELSYYNDILTLKKEYEIFYLIFYGLRTYLERKGKTRQQILDFFLLNLKKIFAHPEEYRIYAQLEQDLIDKSFKILEESNVKEYFAILKNFKGKKGKKINILEFKTPKGFKEMHALLKFITFKKNGKYNLPFFIKRGINKDVWSFSVNASIEGFEEIDLSNLKEELLKEEERKVAFLSQINKNRENEKEKLDNELERLEKDIKEDQNALFYQNLRQLVQEDRYEEFLNSIESLEHRNILLVLYQSLVGEKNKFLERFKLEDDKILILLNECKFADAFKKLKIFKKGLSVEEKREINIFSKAVGEAKGNLIKKITEFSMLSSGEKIERKNEILRDLPKILPEVIHTEVEKCWIIKANMIMTNAEYSSNLEYQDFLYFLRTNLHLVYEKKKK